MDDLDQTPTTEPTIETASEPQADAPKKRGRPSKADIAAREAASQTAPSTATTVEPTKRPRTRKTKPPDEAKPFDAEPQAPNSPGKPNAADDQIAKAIMQILPADKLASVIVDTGNSGLVTIGAMRYGSNASKLAFTKQETDLLKPLTEEWIKGAGVKLTAGQAIGLLVVVMLSQKILVLERERSGNAVPSTPSAPELVAA